MPKIIYSRKQEQGTIDFYASESGRLGAVLRDSSGKETPIEGIQLPPIQGEKDFRNWSQTQVNALLDNSYFTLNPYYTNGQLAGHALTVNLRLKGGWGERQHQGFEEERSHHFPFPKEEVICNPDQGTVIWAEYVLGDVDSVHKHENAKKIGEADNSVDSGKTDPMHLYDEEAQGHHFNIYYKQCRGGTHNDSRMGHAVNHLMRAAQTQDLTKLGRGLHSLQDVFAHTDAFVKRYLCDQEELPAHLCGQYDHFYAHLADGLLEEKSVIGALDDVAFHHALHNSVLADDPFYLNEDHHSFSSLIPEDAQHGLSQRYSDTKTASYLYLYIYRLLACNAADPQIEQEIISRITTSLALPADQLAGRGTHGILGFTNALLENEVIQRNQHLLTLLQSIKQQFIAHGLYQNGDYVITIPPMREIHINSKNIQLLLNVYAEAEKLESPKTMNLVTLKTGHDMTEVEPDRAVEGERFTEEIY